jgi:flagellar hook-associated protein 3 FlgL
MLVNRSMYSVKVGYSALSKMQGQLATYQTQLATGDKASTLAGLGSDRTYSLATRARIDKIAGFSDTIKTLDVRLSVLDKAVSRLDEIEGDTRTISTPGGYGTNDVNLTVLPTIARANLDEVITLLNSEADGRYLFAGNNTEKAPVASIDAILDGVGGKDGFKTVVTQRKQADAGPDGLGRLDVALAGTTTTLSEDGVHPFGLKLSTLSTTSANIALTQPSGSPASLSIDFTAQPLADQSVTIGFTLPDGTAGSITMTATASTAPGKDQFTIGATPAATATNFEAALRTSIETFAGTKGAAASTFAAAENFFPDRGQVAMRVDGPPYDTATALVPATGTDTVNWYTGQNSSGAARQTASAQIDDTTKVNYGVEANESGLVELVRTLAALSVETYPVSDDTAHGRFDAMSERQLQRLAETNNSTPGSLETIAIDLGIAQTTMEQTRERQETYSVQWENILTGIEGISKEEVSMQLLDIQTRLQASYAVTASVANLSLVNYL